MSKILTVRIPMMAKDACKPFRVPLLFALAGMIPALLATVNNSAFGASTYRVRYEGTTEKIYETKQKKGRDTAEYKGVHILTVKGKTEYSGQFFSVSRTLKSSVDGVEEEKTRPARPSIGTFVYKATAGHKNEANLDLERNIALDGFRELILIPDRKLKKGTKFESVFKTSFGSFKARYEVTGKMRFLKKTCLTITRQVSVVSPIRGIDLRLEKWEEEIILEQKMQIPLKRKLSYLITLPGQRVERIFDVEATEIRKLTGRKLASQKEAWDKALALNNAVDLGAREGIKRALEDIDKEGEYGAISPYAEYVLGLIEERAKVVKGLSMQEVSESGTHYYLFVPEDYDPEKSYTLIVALHGSGGRAKPMAQVWAPFAEKNHAIVLAPKSKGSSWDTGGGLVAISKLVSEICGTYNIAGGRKVLFGFSAGAAMSYVVHFFCKEHTFRAVVVACGFMQMAKIRNEISKNLPEHLPRIKGTHFYLLTGERDHCRNGVKSDNTFLDKNGGKVKFVDVPGMGHTFSNKLMPPIFKWLAKALSP